MLSTLLLATTIAAKPAIVVEFDKAQKPHVVVSFNGQTVLEVPDLGFELADGRIGGPVAAKGVTVRDVVDDFPQVTGKRSRVRVAWTETTYAFTERATGRPWDLIVRSSSDAVAFRYRLPKHGDGTVVIRDELTTFRWPVTAKVHALPLNGFTTSYEKRYEVKPGREVPKEWLLGLPLLAALPNEKFAAITEANVTEFAGLYLKPTVDGSLVGRLSPLPGEKNVAVKRDGEVLSPWRVILLGDRLGTLVESDAVLSLSEPCAFQDTTWIKTGKTTFPWWNGFAQDPGQLKPDLDTATAKYYIDFCAEAGIPYHSLDGLRDAWYGGPIVPYRGADPTVGNPKLDLQEVLKYAKSKGVRIRLWMNWKAAEKHMARAFPLYEQWGIEGVMLDFMDRDDQLMNRWVREAVALAAKHKLTVTLHGCPKPTGLERTYPNLLSHEGVMNLEYDKWDKLGITAEHETTVPFTRMLAGPLDFHQGSFRTVPHEKFAPRNVAPLIRGTPARTLASYVVFQNHLSMMVDTPGAYRGHPALPVLAKIPTTWDETKVVLGTVGGTVAIARRSGRDWHVGVMADAKGGKVEVPLNFVGDGSFAATIAMDDGQEKHGINRDKLLVSKTETIAVVCEPGGGAYVAMTPANSR
jgi:alpha-glucosidase